MADRRQEIIESAVESLHSKGYASTSLQDILQAAQIGKGQFYHYFSSKQELGLAIVDHCFEKWNQRVVCGIFTAEMTAKDKIRKMLEGALCNQKADGGKCGCFFGNLALELSEHDELFRQKLNRMFEVWISHLKIILDEIREEEELPLPMESEKLAQSIVAMLEGGIMLMKNRQDVQTLADIADVIKKMVNIADEGREDVA